MRRMILALAALMLICSASVVGSKTQVISRKAVKKAGGSTGDSVNTLPDTSSALQVPANVKDWWYVGMSDSSCRYTLQVSTVASSDTSAARWKTVDRDSIATGDDVYIGPEDYAARDMGFGSLFAGNYIRVIQDAISAPADSATQRTAVWFYFRVED